MPNPQIRSCCFSNLLELVLVSSFPSAGKGTDLRNFPMALHAGCCEQSSIEHEPAGCHFGTRHWLEVDAGEESRSALWFVAPGAVLYLPSSSSTVACREGLLSGPRPTFCHLLHLTAPPSSPPPRHHTVIPYTLSD